MGFTSLEGCAVLVTGASKGIGKGIASVFAGAGANVLMVARDAEAAAAVATELDASAPGTVSSLAGDVRDPDSCHTMAATAIERFGRLDVVCANAGIFPEAKLTEMTAADVDDVIDTNLKGTIHTVRACLPGLLASGRGRVIITSSITGPYTGFPGWTHYGASKAGQLGFMRTAAMELAPQNITVNAVLPGNVLTEGLTGMGEGYLRQMTASIPLGVLGTIHDIGHAALFLATEEARFITGHALVVDGGQILPESGMAMEALL